MIDFQLGESLSGFFRTRQNLSQKRKNTFALYEKSNGGS